MFDNPKKVNIYKERNCNKTGRKGKKVKNKKEVKKFWEDYVALVGSSLWIIWIIILVSLIPYPPPVPLSLPLILEIPLWVLLAFVVSIYPQIKFWIRN